MTIRLITRSSKLALAQCQQAMNNLQTIYPSETFTIIKTMTQGDKDQKTPLYAMPNNGIFIKEIENALLENQADIAIHSLKDVSSTLADGLILAPVSIQEDKHDCLISKSGLPLEKLPKHAKIATSSMRRIACLKRIRSDLEFISIRGNIDTRIKKLYQQDIDAIILAKAGLVRLHLEDKITQIFDYDQVIPACNQGALGLEMRQEDKGRFSLLFQNENNTSLEAKLEREFLSKANIGCHAPVGCVCQIKEDKIFIHAMLGKTIEDTRFISLDAPLSNYDFVIDQVLEKLRKKDVV